VLVLMAVLSRRPGGIWLAHVITLS
jgi:hypothetical protein